MRKLDNVTLICVSDVRLPRSMAALDICRSYFDFAEVKLLTSRETSYEFAVKIEPIKSIKDYNKFILEKLADYFTTSHCLIVQWDGYILNPEAWNDEWLEYDYIGAPYSCQPWEVGNGGFSLRSRKLMEFTQEAAEYYNFGEQAEDVVICKKLNTEVFNIAPVEVAQKFSVEGRWNKEFGFHNFHFATNLPVWDERNITASHSGDIGDIIYCLPTIRALNIKELYLYTNQNLGTQFNDAKYKAVKPLLENQGIRVLKYDEFTFVDYHLDAYRVHPLHLAIQHLALSQAFPFEVDIDLSKKFVFLNKEPYKYDIVINRSERYHNDNIDYKFITSKLTRKSIIFLGLPKEYFKFVEETGVKATYIPTDNLLEAAEIINQSRVFIGNQSSLYSIAEGLKVNRILEVCTYTPNCMPQTSNGFGLIEQKQNNYAVKLINQWLDEKTP